MVVKKGDKKGLSRGAKQEEEQEEVVVVKEAGEEDADEGDDFYEGRQHCSTACARALPLFDMHVARRWGGE